MTQTGHMPHFVTGNGQTSPDALQGHMDGKALYNNPLMLLPKGSPAGPSPGTAFVYIGGQRAIDTAFPVRDNPDLMGKGPVCIQAPRYL